MDNDQQTWELGFNPMGVVKDIQSSYLKHTEILYNVSFMSNILYINVPYLLYKTNILSIIHLDFQSSCTGALI